MANIEIKQLVNFGRFSSSEGNLLLTILYTPLGILFFLFRCILTIIFIVLGQILPNTPTFQTLLNNLACFCFGITVSVENQKKKENVEVYVSNSLSIFDHLALTKAIGAILPLNKTPLKNLPALGILDLGSMGNAEAFKKNLEAVTKDRKTPLLVCPEDTPTNGNGLLKFNSQYFKFFQKVQPLSITVKRPILDISISTLGSTYMNDVLYFMFSPFTNYNIKFLPSMEKKCLSEDEFADIVRQNIATELKVDATNFTSSEVTEWSKRQLAEEKRRNQERAVQFGGTNRLANPEIARMATQVKDVFPHVPVSAIYNDLVTTRSVDTTITNILEGRVRFIPEQPRPPSTSITSSSFHPSTSRGYSTSKSTQSSVMISLGAASFGKNASERSRSFQERKEAMIAAARQRYIEKHKLNISL